MASSLYRLHSPSQVADASRFPAVFAFAASLLTMPSFSSNQETPDFRESSGCMTIFSPSASASPNRRAPHCRCALQFGRGRLNGRQQISKPAPQRLHFVANPLEHGLKRFERCTDGTCRRFESFHHATEKCGDGLPVFPDNQRHARQCSNHKTYRTEQST